MRRVIAGLVTTMLVVASTQAKDVSFHDLQEKFQQSALSLLSETNAPIADIQTKVAQIANKTFGEHPDVMKKETERQLSALPSFPENTIATYVEYDALPADSMVNDDGTWIVFGWNPERIAATAVQMIRMRRIDSSEFGRLMLLQQCCPNKVYRLGNSKIPDLVVESLGDLFLIKIELTEQGIGKPLSVKWMTRKESRTVDNSPEQ